MLKARVLRGPPCELNPSFPSRSFLTEHLPGSSRLGSTNEVSPLPLLVLPCLCILTQNRPPFALLRGSAANNFNNFALPNLPLPPGGRFFSLFKCVLIDSEHVYLLNIFNTWPENFVGGVALGIFPLCSALGFWAEVSFPCPSTSPGTLKRHIMSPWTPYQPICPQKPLPDSALAPWIL